MRRLFRSLFLTFLGVIPTHSDAVDLTEITVVEGREGYVLATGNTPGALVRLYKSRAGQGLGPCPPVLSPNCLDLVNPVLVEEKIADVAGEAVFAPEFPPESDGFEISFQAVERAGLVYNVSTPVTEVIAFDPTDLVDLEFSAGDINESVSANRLGYTANVAFLSATTTITATASDPASEVSIDGELLASGETSSVIDLDEGNNSITISIFSADGLFAKSYFLELTRAAEGQFYQQTYIKASNPNNDDLFGWSVSMDGDRLAVGALLEGSDSPGVNGDQFNEGEKGSGAVYIFARNGDDWVQEAYLKASNPERKDNFGDSLALDGDTLVVGATGEDSAATGIGGDESDNSAPDITGAVYVFTRDPVAETWSQEAYIKASNTDPNDNFGASVALDANTLVVGAPDEESTTADINGDETDNGNGNSSGAAYVFVRVAGEWSQEAYLKPWNNPTFGTRLFFGGAVGVVGDTIAVGADWEDGNATGIDGDPFSFGAFTSGAVYTFERTGSVWTQGTYIKASNTGSGDRFGRRIAFDEDTLAVAASRESSDATGVDGDQTNDLAEESGAVYVFVRDPVTEAWYQEAYLKASNTAPEEPTVGLGQGDLFGFGLALDGNTLVVGAFGEDSDARGVDGDGDNQRALNSGAAYVFTREAGVWSEPGYLKASNADAFDNFGWSVGVAGSTVVVGAYLEDSSAIGVGGNQADNARSASGAVYVFER